MSYVCSKDKHSFYRLAKVGKIPKREITKNDPEPFKFPILPEEGRDNEVLGCLEGPVYNYKTVNGKDYNDYYGISGFCVEPDLIKIILVPT